MQNVAHRVIGALIVASVFACGGGDDDDTVADGGDDQAAVAEASDPVTDGTETAVVPPETDAPSAPSAGGTSGAAGSGFVEVDGTRYEVTVVRCVDMAGALGGGFEGTDDADNVGGTFSFSPDDWEDRNASEGWTEAGSVTVRVEDPYLQWEAGASMVEAFVLPDGVAADDIVITSFDIDEEARSVIGEAVFLDVNKLMTGVATEPQAGTFEFNCPPN